MREPSRRPSDSERTRSVRLNRNLQVHLLHLLTVPACKHSRAEGPPSDPLRTVNSKPWTGRKRQDRSFLKEASNAPARNICPKQLSGRTREELRTLMRRLEDGDRPKRSDSSGTAPDRRGGGGEVVDTL